MIKEGKFKARPIEGLFSKSKEKGTPCVGLLFEIDVDTDGNKEQMWWTGWLTETLGRDQRTPAERSADVLALCGFTGKHDPDGKIPGASLNLQAEVQVTIKDEPYTDRNNVTRSQLKIAFVNKPGGSQYAQVEPQEVSDMVQNVNLMALLAASRANLGIKEGTGAVTKPAATTAKTLVNHAPGAATKAPPPPPPDFNEEVPY